jgi:hypothetical protein
VSGINRSQTNRDYSTDKVNGGKKEKTRKKQSKQTTFYIRLFSKYAGFSPGYRGANGALLSLEEGLRQLGERFLQWGERKHKTRMNG